MFLSKDRGVCQRAANPRIIESALMGYMLGYPHCCVKRYMDNIRKARGKQSDFILFTEIKMIKYPYQNNVCLKPFKINLLSHFPCSFDCRLSVLIAKKHESFLKIRYPEIAKEFEKTLKSFVVYTEYQGVHYANDYELRQNSIIFRNLCSSADTTLGLELRKGGEVTFSSFNNFSIEKKKYHSNDIGLLLFA